MDQVPQRSSRFALMPAPAQAPSSNAAAPFLESSMLSELCPEFCQTQGIDPKSHPSVTSFTIPPLPLGMTTIYA
ncbi:hypothetical protein AZE42_11130 [Rhizopogon vesiculosus]|uniref:Uncharacterized protein n=1 Tax=Rhizopogon vesiculosus TaxID=180088 RepID=A0A1J8R6C1_9AGAM|nr:hypothetical protein AZE42_11130 [Rhizopogon vesiculosus]